MKDQDRHPRENLHPSSGFTLVELLISIALTVVLITAVMLLFSVAFSTKSSAEIGGRLLTSVQVGTERLGEMLGNCEGVRADGTRLPSETDPPVFILFHQFGPEPAPGTDLPKRSLDALVFKTTSFLGIAKDSQGQVEEMPQNVVIYVHKGQLVAEGLLKKEIPQGKEEIESLMANPLKGGDRRIQLLSEGVIEFQVEYLDLAAKAPLDPITSVRLTPQSGADARSYKVPGGDPDSAGQVRWDDYISNTPANEAHKLHDRYTEAQMTTPRALRITLTVQDQDHEHQRRFQIILRVRSSQITQD